MAQRQGRPQRRVRLESLEQINVDEAGLDIGGSGIWACVPEARSSEAVRRFDTFTSDLHALADWLSACGIATVAMESTGIYWIPIYEILEQRGMTVCLVNAQVTKNVTGRKS